MAALNRIVRMLEAQRRELLDQLDAIDRAIAALSGAGKAPAEPEPAEAAEAEVPAPHTASVMLPSRVKPRRVLSDSHKYALTVGKRKAREATNVAKGLVREMPGDSFVPAIGTRGDHQPPRLVKRSIKS